ncbi:MAG TPA: pyridoxal phosphate-dependent aminotransferase [Candidatus Acidoferrales bacterium]|nr:pyridoxal phosphate-dependent aminotransferase [Candidatus Acidoferrales bacterium]
MFSQRTNWNLQENAYALAVRRHRQGGRSLLDLTISNPTLCGFNYDQAAIFGALRHSAALRYEPEPRGFSPARAAVVDYYREKNPGVTLDPERVILTTGTSEAYSFLFRLLCEPGDEVLVAHPSYPLFDFLAGIEDVKLCAFPLLYDQRWQFDFLALRQAIGPRTRAILVVHPNNPTGHFISRAEAEQIATICRDHGLALVVDEVFLDYEVPAAQDNRKHQGTFVGHAQALTFVLSGLSKIAALPQMKVGWIVADGPEALVSDAMARLEVIADTYLSLNAPMQHGLAELLAQRRTIQPQILSRVEANLEQLDERLARQESIARLKIEGGWYAVVRVPAVQSDEDLAIRLIEEQSVLVYPGHFYDFAHDGYLVISLLARIEEFAEGVGRVIGQK